MQSAYYQVHNAIKPREATVNPATHLGSSAASGRS